MSSSSMSLDMDNTWVAPDHSIVKVMLKRGFGFEGPQEGASCFFDIMEDEQGLLRSFHDKSTVLGEADSLISFYFEIAIKAMKEEEECELYFSKKALTGKNLEHRLKNEVKPIRKPPGNLETENKEHNEEPGPIENESTQPQACISKNSSTEETSEESVKTDSIDETEGGNTTNIPTYNEQKRSSKCSPENFVFAEKDYIKVKLTLTSFSREPEIWEISITEKWRRFNHHKNKGVELYSHKQYYWAFRRFSIAIKHLISLQYEIPVENQNEKGMEINNFKMSCYLNLAACQLKHRNYEHAIINCTKALEIDPNNPKALYRRGTGYTHIQEYEKAQVDLDKALEIEPNRLAIQNQLKVLRNSVHKLNQYYANCMKKMFT